MADKKPMSSDEIMDIDDIISTNSPSNILCAQPSDVFPSKNLLDAIRFILDNNTYQTNNATLSIFQEEIFIIIEKLFECPRKMFECLQEHFAKHFDTNLTIIAFDNKKFSIINNVNHGQKYVAFLSFNKDNTVCGPLYTINVDGNRQTVFSTDNIDTGLDVYMYVDQLNNSKPSNGVPQIQEQQAVPCAQELTENLLTDNNSTSTNQFNLFTADQVDVKTHSRIVLDQMLQQMFRIFDSLPLDPQTLCQILQPFVSYNATFEHLSLRDVIMASKDGINFLSYLVQLVEQPLLIYQNEQAAMSERTLPNDINNEIRNETNQLLSNADIPFNPPLTTTADINNLAIEEPIDIVKNYESPTLIKELESTFHPRTLKEFAKTGSSPIKCIDSKQREPIGIRVPPNDNTSLYLGMELIGLDGQTHPSKVLVPQNTMAENELLMNNNDLNCLNFSQCDKNWIFNHDTKRLYSEISPTERQGLPLRKDIHIHMINLYQRGEITKERIKGKDLKKCRLALWFCILKNGIFECVSSIFHSNEITDSMRNDNPKRKIVKKNTKRLSKTTKKIY